MKLNQCEVFPTYSNWTINGIKRELKPRVTCPLLVTVNPSNSAAISLARSKLRDFNSVPCKSQIKMSDQVPATYNDHGL